MAEKRNNEVLQSSAGLTRYYDVKENGIKINPKTIIAVAIGFSISILILNIL